MRRKSVRPLRLGNGIELSMTEDPSCQLYEWHQQGVNQEDHAFSPGPPEETLKATKRLPGSKSWT